MPPEHTPLQPSNQANDLVSATETLFLDIAKGADIPLKEAVSLMNSRRRLIRAYEAALIPDGEEELAALKTCWVKRDISGLKTLIGQYYRRRQALAPQIVALINGSNVPQ